MPTKKRPEKETLITLYTSGLSDWQIARRLKVNRSTVYRWRRHYGIQVTTDHTFTARLVKGAE
jgi:transposase-like protein